MVDDGCEVPLTPNPHLSVAIPTYNRTAELAECLQSIVAQAKAFGVRIYVSDNASPGDTQAIVGQFQQSYPYIYFRRNDTNLGIDGNVRAAMAMAESHFVWLFSDDDVLKPGAIRTVLEAIRSSYGLIVVNSECRDGDLSHLVATRRLAISADRVYVPSESEQFFVDAADYMTFIGCLVFRRDLWDQCEKEKYVGTSFVHVGAIFQQPLEADVLVIAEPLIQIRLGNAEWSARAFEIWMFKWPNLIWSFSHYSQSARRAVVRPEPWRRLTVLLRYRARGAYSAPLYRQWLQQRLTPWWKRQAAYLIALIPECIANIIGLVYYSIFLYSPIELVDLRASRAYYRNCLARLYTLRRPKKEAAR
jgi:abequosyltransferase